jgi:hypothetical protein
MVLDRICLPRARRNPTILHPFCMAKAADLEVITDVVAMNIAPDEPYTLQFRQR